jgi:hypothetical protein
MQKAHLKGLNIRNLLVQGSGEISNGKTDARFPLGLEKIKVATDFLNMGYPVLFEPYRILETVDFDVLRVPDFTNLKGHKVAYDNLTGLEPGIIKSVNPLLCTAQVVYNCGGDWENYERYTGVQTPFNKLKFSW